MPIHIENLLSSVNYHYLPSVCSVLTCGKISTSEINGATETRAYVNDLTKIVMQEPRRFHVVAHKQFSMFAKFMSIS